jgi:fucose 4-O-acetylase-like acetyltransferase
MTVVQIKTTALRLLLFVVGVVVGIGLFFLAGFVLAVLGFYGGYAVYNGYFLVIALWLIAAVATYFGTKSWAPGKRVNLAVFLVGTVAFSLLGGLPVLFTTPEALIFWPR